MTDLSQSKEFRLDDPVRLQKLGSFLDGEHSTGHLLAGVTCDLGAAKQKIAGHKYQPHSPPLHPFNYFPLSVAAAKSPPLSPCLLITHVHETSVCHTSYLSILVHRRIIEVYKKYTKKLSELATK